MASKFFEHFIYIANSINHQGMWDDDDGFYYDVIHDPGGGQIPLKVRSFVGLIPLFAVETIDPELFEMLPRFKKRMDWFIENRPHLLENIASLTKRGSCYRCLLSLVGPEKLRRVLIHMLDENKFLSDYGLRSLSKEHRTDPFSFAVGGQTSSVGYQPGESPSGLFGGNSNWRGPIWFPVNYLMIESLKKYHHYFGVDFKVELPTGSGKNATLKKIAADISHRLINIFLRDHSGERAFNGDNHILQNDPQWRDKILFYEYLHGDSGRGLGASHQTGWTALVAKLIQQSGAPEVNR